MNKQPKKFPPPAPKKQVPLVAAKKVRPPANTGEPNFRRMARPERLNIWTTNRDTSEGHGERVDRSVTRQEQTDSMRRNLARKERQRKMAKKVAAAQAKASQQWIYNQITQPGVKRSRPKNAPQSREEIYNKAKASKPKARPKVPNLNYDPHNPKNTNPLMQSNPTKTPKRKAAPKKGSSKRKK
jgi:hypothetical protein